MTQQQAVTPWRSIVPWVLAAIAGAAGLVLAHGFRTPPIENADHLARILMAAGLGLFVLSRVLMFVPATAVGRRLARWWVDFVLILAGAAWWIIKPDSEPFILWAGTAYILVVGASAIARSTVALLSESSPKRRMGAVSGRLFGMALVLILVGGFVLTLPVCRRSTEAVESTHQLAWYHAKVAFLDNTFTAAAALTGTGLTVQDIGYEYNRAGQAVVLVLMQIGGLAVLSVAGIAAMNLRRLLGWSGVDDDLSPAGMRRLVLFVCVSALIIEAIGAVGLYRMWDPAIDLNFHTATQEPAILGKFVQKHFGWKDYDEARLFASVFHSVSGFCDCGLTLTRDGYLAYRNLPGPLLAIVPLMFLGSLGGPVLLEVLKRMTRRSDVGLEGISKDTYVTLGGSVLVLLLGAVVLFGIESTRDLQLRYPREKTPGRLMVNGTSPSGTTSTAPGGNGGRFASTQPVERAPIEFSSATSQRAQKERLNGMTTRNRVRAALFHAESSRVGGVKAARIDEASLSPASHFAMLGLMLIGGGAGGAAGGLRIVIVYLLIATIWSAGRARSPHGHEASGPDRARVIGIAAGVATAMVLLIGIVTILLAYRETGTPLACLFESVSACCNVGLSLGLTADLSLFGRVVVILAMLIGRFLPLAILLRSTAPVRQVKTRPIVEAPTPPKEDDDAPIPLE